MHSFPRSSPAVPATAEQLEPLGIEVQIRASGSPVAEGAGPVDRLVAGEKLFAGGMVIRPRTDPAVKAVVRIEPAP